LGGDLSGILVGYFNCWGPKFTVSAILKGGIFCRYYKNIQTQKMAGPLLTLPLLSEA
jgi:hypothetical protein